MSLNNLVLHPVTLTGLYKENLVEIMSSTMATPPAEPVTKVVPVVSPPDIPAYLGENRRQIALLVNYGNHVYLPDDQLLFLTNILKACQLNIADIAIINTAQQSVGLPRLKAALGTRQLILFGPNGMLAGDAEVFTIREIDGVSILAAPELEKLNTNTENGKLLKSRLWTCLKQLFNV